MNYVQHTRAAHEWLLAQPASRPLHMSLYMALFHQWNTERFPKAIELDHEATMRAARIGSRHTYRDTLRDLAAWGLLTYQPSKSKHTDSRCYMAVLSGPEVAQVKPPTEATSGPDETELPGPEVAPMEGATEATSGPDESFTEATSGPTLHIVKTGDVNSVVVNGTAAPKKKEGQDFSDDGLSSAEVLDDTAEINGAVPTPGAAPKKKVAPKKKGVQAGTIHAAATAQATGATATAGTTRSSRQKRPETTFQESAIYPKAAFVAAFEGTDYALADLNHYHEAVNLWRDKITGELPRRADWVATAKRFMFNDATDNRLKLAPGSARHEPGTNPAGSTQNPGGSTTGYRSSRWDS